ncbi:bifunctional 2-polyprenyl-6-hydroxyphenol methylase/3-demethylubiquinol 3-O-methyltransferase UbiG [Anabaena sp. PCC 7108]|uniref:class I SAM-dependent methyltransferase n=1 Tax=Anabaena sp. PCC 7108 TaxID=163908 RepID=UPI000348AF1E|nr:class I SAM-dependent methyltransferase [Anabaena sp. PCC 7108]
MDKTSMSYSEVNKIIAQILEVKFQYEANLQTGTPSGNYFWYRKRKEVADLISKNIQLLSSINKDTPSHNFVDVGCGDGLDIFLIKQLFDNYSVKYHYLGLEGSPASYRICNLRKEYFNADNIDFKTVDITNSLPLDDGSVDLLYCSEVIEHILNPTGFLKELRRVIKTGGYFILTTPNEPNIFQKSYWLSNARSKTKALQNDLRDNPTKFLINGKEVPIYGHISCRTDTEWDQTLGETGFSLIDYRRGAIVYGGTPYHDQDLILGLKFLLESFLNILPKRLTRSISNQVVALYQATT